MLSSYQVCVCAWDLHLFNHNMKMPNTQWKLIWIRDLDQSIIRIEICFWYKGSHQKEIGKTEENFLNKGGGPGFLTLCVFLVTPCLIKVSKNAMNHMILSFKMKADVTSYHFLMLWLQKESLDTVGFRTFRGGLGFLNRNVDFGGLKWHLDS